MKWTGAIAKGKAAKRSDLVSVTIVAAHIVFVLAPIYIAASTPRTTVLILAYLWFGTSMQGLLNLMHECAHYHVFRHRRGSDFLGRWLLAPLMVADFDKYRRLHWAHHRDLGNAGDPKYTYRVEIGAWHFPLFLARCFLGVEALRKFSYQRGDPDGNPQPSSPVWLLRVCLFQAVFGGSLILAAYLLGARSLSESLRYAAVSYAFVYVYGLMSLTILAATLRAIAEHQRGANEAVTAGRAALRNLKCGPLGRLVLGCYGFAEHATHHWEPALPYYFLKSATTELARTNRDFAPYHTYASILMERVRAQRALRR